MAMEKPADDCFLWCRAGMEPVPMRLQGKENGESVNHDIIASVIQRPACPRARRVKLVPYWPAQAGLSPNKEGIVKREQSQERTSKDLTQQEVDLLIRFAQGMDERISAFYCLDPFNPKSPPDSEREYLGLWFRLHIQSDPLLQLCQSFIGSSPNRMLPNVEWFAENILAPENLVFDPNDKTRMKWAVVARDVVQDILGLRKNAGIIQLRNEIIRKLKLRKMSQEEICKELDSNEGLRKSDPRLDKWCSLVVENRRLFGYHAAFIHPRLKINVKKMISTA